MNIVEGVVMDNFYKEVENFINQSSDSEEVSPKIDTDKAVNLHQTIDVFVKKLQLLKEYIELLDDEAIFLSEENNKFPSVYDNSIFELTHEKIKLIENSLYTSRFESMSQNKESIEDVKNTLNNNIEKMYKLGDSLRNSEILKNIGG